MKGFLGQHASVISAKKPSTALAAMIGIARERRGGGGGGGEASHHAIVRPAAAITPATGRGSSTQRYMCWLWTMAVTAAAARVVAEGSMDKPVYMTDGKIYPPPTGAHVTRGVPGGEAPIPLSQSSFDIVAGRGTSQTLQKSIKRLRTAPFAYGPAPPAPPYRLIVQVDQQQTTSTVTGGPTDPDESYELNVTSASAILVARTDFGALRGLNSFIQLVQYNLTTQANYVIIPQLITDSPRLAYRGVMVDTGRVFISVAQLRTLCNAMEAWRFNVLNIHLTDVQSWPMEINGLPDLSGLLSYRHETRRHVYTIADARNLTEHCLERGVRVIPEIDAPGTF